MNKTDIVQLSMQPHCAPLPQNRDAHEACAWAKETFKIIHQASGLSEMRAQRTLFDIIAIDWPEGLQALGMMFGQQDPMWWNPVEVNKNPLALAAHQNRIHIVEAMTDDSKMGKFVETRTLAAALLGTPNLRHFEADILDHLIEAIKSKREHFIEHDRTKLSNSVLIRFLEEGRADFVVDVYGFEDMDRVQAAWLSQGLRTIVMKMANSGVSTSGVNIPASGHNGKDLQEAIKFIAKNQAHLVDLRKWQEQGNTIFQVHMERGSDEATVLLEKYRPMLDAPSARQVIPRMKAWDTRVKLSPGATQTPLRRRPAGM